jgi:hypothetical protein
VHVGVSTFIPKPDTPFQWVAFEDPEVIQEKLSLLHDGFHRSKIKMTWNNPQASMVEAWLSRGDRRMAGVIFHAWQNGARFDAWGEHFNFDYWHRAFEQTGQNPEFYSKRERALEETLPWDHINAGVRKAFLARDFEWSKEGKTRPDCRHQCYACGILEAFSKLRSQNPDGRWMCP